MFVNIFTIVDIKKLKSYNYEKNLLFMYSNIICIAKC